MHRLIMGLLLIAFLALGTGGARYAHQASHEHDAAVGALVDRGLNQWQAQEAGDDHDEHGCSLCALFVLPILVLSLALRAMGLGLVRLTRVVRHSFPVLSQTLSACGCRGPPVL